MTRLLGTIDIYPWIQVDLRTSEGVSFTISCLLDTGYDGAIALPETYRSAFGSSDNKVVLEYPNGQNEITTFVPCTVRWVDGDRNINAVYIPGDRPLLGMELLDNTITTLEMTNGTGEITVEAQ